VIWLLIENRKSRRPAGPRFSSPDRWVGVNVSIKGLRSEGPESLYRAFGHQLFLRDVHPDLTAVAISYRRFAPHYRDWGSDQL